MHQIIIVLSNSSTNFVSTFKDEGTALAASQNIHDRRKDYLESGNDSIVTVKDDYGHVANIMASVVSGVLLTDVENEFEANCDRAIIQKRSEKKFGDRVNSDPLLKLMFAQPANMPFMPGGHQ